MIALDTNILVAFLRKEYALHDAAVACVRTLAEGAVPWAIPWPCLHEFLAVVTNPRIFKKPSRLEDALAAAEALMQSPTAHLLAEGPGYWSVLKRLVTEGHVAGARVHDARVAALCLAQGVSELWTADRDFSRFPTLVARNPLAAGPS